MLRGLQIYSKTLPFWNQKRIMLLSFQLNNLKMANKREGIAFRKMLKISEKYERKGELDFLTVTIVEERKTELL